MNWLNDLNESNQNFRLENCSYRHPPVEISLIDFVTKWMGWKISTAGNSGDERREQQLD